MLEQASIDGIATKPANIASPLKKFFKLLAKGLVEDRPVWPGWFDRSRLHNAASFMHRDHRRCRSSSRAIDFEGCSIEAKQVPTPAH
jgi:hypothetical protein